MNIVDMFTWLYSVVLEEPIRMNIVDTFTWLYSVVLEEPIRISKCYFLAL